MEHGGWNRGGAQGLVAELSTTWAESQGAWAGGQHDGDTEMESVEVALPDRAVQRETGSGGEGGRDDKQKIQGHI